MKISVKEFRTSASPAGGGDVTPAVFYDFHAGKGKDPLS